LARKQNFNPEVPLPPGLTIEAIKRAIEFMERELADLVEVYMEQSNVFSAIVGIMGTRALDQVSNYEKHRNVDTAQQRFPDLKRRGTGQSPRPIDCLEQGKQTPMGNSGSLQSLRLVHSLALSRGHHRVDRASPAGADLAGGRNFSGRG
jgi:hypothetical protein